MRHPFEQWNSWRWAVIAPVALIAVVVLAIIWADFATGGEAKPPPLLGEIGTPVRGTFIAPTPGPTGVKPTPRPRPTLTTGASGSPTERDSKRRSDVLILFNALKQLKSQKGQFPTTNNNIQSLCVYQGIDVGCTLKDVLGADPPEDPLGEPGKNGYWYQSDGNTAKLYVSMEGGIDDKDRCDTDYVDFQDFPNLICPTTQ